MFVMTRMSISPSHGNICRLFLTSLSWCLNENPPDSCSSAESSLEVGSMSMECGIKRQGKTSAGDLVYSTATGIKDRFLIQLDLLYSCF